MEKRLSEAALQGDLESLRQILEEDSLILDRIIVSCISETPLHIASTLGHLSLVKEFLIRKPELASELDSCGCSPLHLAAAKGHVDIVEELLRADAELCLVRNSDGRNALHMAAIKGRAAVIAVMVRDKPECTRFLTDRGETCLHLCVKWNRLEELKFLAEFMCKNGEFLNWKDCEGNSVLHIAVTKKNIEIINHLLTLNGLEINASNKNGSTPMDVLMQSPRDLRDMDIEHALIEAGALSFKDLNLITDEWIPEKAKISKQEVKDEDGDEGLDEDEEEDGETLCGACGEKYASDEFWICCDLCERWFHGHCVKITSAIADHMKQYKCPTCSNKRSRL